jgi:hypothetical protein
MHVGELEILDTDEDTYEAQCLVHSLYSHMIFNKTS